MESEKKKKSPGLRLLGAVSTLMLVCCAIFIMVVEANLLVIGVVLAALGGLAAPSVMAGEGLLECIIGFFEMLLEGIMAIVEGIVTAISSIFG